MVALKLNTFQKKLKTHCNINIITNIYRIQGYDSKMRGYFFIGFIEFMFRNKSLGGFTNLFLPNNFGKNDKKLKNFVVKYNRLMKYGSKAPNKFIYN